MTVPAALDFHAPAAAASGNEFIGLLKTVIASLTREVGRRLSSHGLTDAQWIPILLVSDGRCRTVAEIARWNGCDPGAMTRTISRLEAKKLLVRERSKSDRRVVELRLTDSGKAVAALVPAVLAEVLNLHLAGFDRDEWRLLLALLTRLKANGTPLLPWLAARAEAGRMPEAEATAQA